MASYADRGVSPLMSNNPFRNRVVSTISPADTRTAANPFLDVNEVSVADVGTTVAVPAHAATTVNTTTEAMVRPILAPMHMHF